MVWNLGPYCNEHQWGISYGDNVPNECQHRPLSSECDKGWLKGAIPPHDALIKIVTLENTLLSKLQNVILKYVWKRNALVH